MRQRLFGKYFLTMALIVVFSFGALMLILTLVYNDYVANLKYDSLKKVSTSVSDFAGNQLNAIEEAQNNRGLYYIVKNVSGINDNDVFITNNYGIIKVCSCEEFGQTGTCGHSGSKIPDTVLKNQGLSGNKGIGDLDLYKEQQYFYTCRIFNSDNKQIGFVVSTSSLASVKQLTKKVIRFFLFSAIVPVALLFFALYGMTLKISKPIKLMSDASKAMAKGDFSKRIPVTSDDEIGELAVSFNQMTNSLSRLEETRKSFVANVSHELKTPMTTISGFVDGIIDGTIEPEKQKYYLTIVSEEVKRLSRMVQSMLSISKLESGEFVLKYEKFDFRELLLRIVVSQEQRIEEKKLDIVGLDSIESVTLNADKDLIYRVIYNLVDNAIKFTDEKGTVTFSQQTDARNLKFVIRNTGKGIPATELPLVFERFYKLDKSRSANKTSMGLGLYIVKTIVKTHGGTISVSSVENEFTEFTVTLPLIK